MKNEGIATVDLVLNAASLQSGAVKYNIKPMDLKDIIKEIIDEAKGPAKLKGLKLKTDVKDQNYAVSGDAFWLKEVAHSLVDNALKYTPRGEVAIKLEKLDNKVLFSVKDTGVGLTGEDKENLFKEGGRGKDSLRVNVNSTGYGLFMAKMIVEAHQGRIWAESAGKDQGSQFYLELPET